MIKVQVPYDTVYNAFRNWTRAKALPYPSDWTELGIFLDERIDQFNIYRPEYVVNEEAARKLKLLASPNYKFLLKVEEAIQKATDANDN